MIPLYAEKTREMNHRLKGRSGGRMQSFLPQPEKKETFPSSLSIYWLKHPRAD
jgi:hypothetical protein